MIDLIPHRDEPTILKRLDKERIRQDSCKCGAGTVVVDTESLSGNSGIMGDDVRLTPPCQESQGSLDQFAEYALPTCRRYHKQLPVISKSQLSEHNHKCRSLGQWHDLWSPDTEFVYNGYRLVEFLRQRVEETYEKDKSRFLMYGSHYKSFQTKLKFAEKYPLFSLDNAYSHAMFVVSQLDMDYSDMKRARCVAIVGKLSEQDPDCVREAEKQGVLSLLHESSPCDIPLSVDDNLRVIATRHLNKISVEEIPYHSTRDLNNLEFRLPEGVMVSVLRSWLQFWKPLDFTISEDGYAWEHLPLSGVKLPDTHQVFSELVSRDRFGALDTTLDSDVVWQTLPDDVIQQDQPTEAQCAIISTRQQRPQLSYKRQKAKHQRLLSRFEDKYEIDAVSDYQAWIEVMTKDWEDFQRLCDSWSEPPHWPHQRLHTADHVSTTTMANTTVTSEHEFLSKRRQSINDNNYAPDPEPTGLWADFISGASGRERNLSPRSNTSVLFGDLNFSDETSVTSTNNREVTAKDRIRSPTKESRLRGLGNGKMQNGGISAIGSWSDKDTSQAIHLIKQDIFQDSPHCSTLCEDLIRILDSSLGISSDVSHKSSSPLPSALNDCNFKLPVGVSPNDLRPNLNRSLRRIPCPDTTPSTANSSTFYEYMSPLSPPVEKQICFGRAKKAKVGKSSSSHVTTINSPDPIEGTRRWGHRCCRSPDLFCNDCLRSRSSNPYRDYGGNTYFKTSGPGWQKIKPWAYTSRLDHYQPIFPWCTMVEIPEPTPEQQAQCRAKIFESFAKRHHYSEVDLEVFKGWATRMQDAWNVFQELCDK